MANAGHRIISFAVIEICEGAYSLAGPRIAPNYSTSLLLFPQVFHSCNLLGSCWSLGRFFSLPERHVWVTALVLALVVVLLDLCLVWGANTAWDDRPVYSFNLSQENVLTFLIEKINRQLQMFMIFQRIRVKWLKQYELEYNSKIIGCYTRMDSYNKNVQYINLVTVIPSKRTIFITP